MDRELAILRDLTIERPKKIMRRFPTAKEGRIGDPVISYVDGYYYWCIKTDTEWYAIPIGDLDGNLSIKRRLTANQLYSAEVNTDIAYVTNKLGINVPNPSFPLSSKGDVRIYNSSDENILVVQADYNAVNVNVVCPQPDTYTFVVQIGSGKKAKFSGGPTLVDKLVVNYASENYLVNIKSGSSQVAIEPPALRIHTTEEDAAGPYYPAKIVHTPSTSRRNNKLEFYVSNGNYGGATEADRQELAMWLRGDGNALLKSNQPLEDIFPVFFACPGKNERIHDKSTYYVTDTAATYDTAFRFVSGWTGRTNLIGTSYGFPHRFRKYHMYARVRMESGATGFVMGIYNSTDGTYPLADNDFTSSVTTTYKTIYVGSFEADWDDDDNVYIFMGKAGQTGYKYVDYILIVPDELTGGTYVTDNDGNRKASGDLDQDGHRIKGQKGGQFTLSIPQTSIGGTSTITFYDFVVPSGKTLYIRAIGSTWQPSATYMTIKVRNVTDSVDVCSTTDYYLETGWTVAGGKRVQVQITSSAPGTSTCAGFCICEIY